MAAWNLDNPAFQADLSAAKSELKIDIKNFRDELKADVKNLRDELKSDINRLAKAQIETQDRVTRIEATMATKTDIERILSAIDAFAKKGEAYDRKSFSHGDILQSHEVKLREHDKRLTTLEAK